MPHPETVVFRLTAVWTAIGLVGGLAYREITKANDFTGFTQLAVFHTHALVLGTLVGLGLLALQRVYPIGRDRRFPWLLWVWTIGLAITVAGMAVNGTLQVLGSPLADGPALAGLSGTGHIVLTVGFVLLLLVLGRAVREQRIASAGATELAGPVAAASTVAVDRAS